MTKIWYGLMCSAGFTVRPTLKPRLEVFCDHSVPGSVMELMTATIEMEYKIHEAIPMQFYVAQAR